MKAAGVCTFAAIDLPFTDGLGEKPQNFLYRSLKFAVLYEAWLYILAHHCQPWPFCWISVFSPTFILQPVDWEQTLASLEVDKTVGETEWAKPGTKAGTAMLESFIDLRLKIFDTKRNDPNAPALSQLSPWIRFGQ